METFSSNWYYDKILCAHKILVLLEFQIPTKACDLTNPISTFS